MAIFLFLSSGFARAQAPDPVQQFELGRAAHQYQDYKKVVKLLKPLLYPTVRLTERARVLKAREYLGTSYWWLKDKGAFNQEMTAYLILDPGASLDPFFYPPEMILDFKNLKKRLLEMKIIKPVTVQEPEKKPQRLVIERTETRRDPIATWVPFGVGQFVNRKPGKGIFFLASQVLALGVNVGAWTYMRQNGGGGEHRETAVWTMYGAVGAFAVLAVWGVVDARLQFEPSTVRERRRLEAAEPPPGLFAPSIVPSPGDPICHP